MLIGAIRAACMAFGAAPGSADPDGMGVLKQAIEKRIVESGVRTISVALHDLANGREILIQPDVSYHPASAFKLCVMMETYHQAADGRFSLDDALPVKNEFKSIADGSSFNLSADDDSDSDLYKRVGESMPIRDLIERMITQSSNLATNLLIERVGPDRVTAYMRQLGAKDLLVRRGVEDGKAFAKGLNNAATAHGLMRVLARLAEHKVVSRQASEEMIGVLKLQRHNEGIPRNLPAGVEVAHKTGWIEKIYHDAAVVYPLNPARRKPYVLVVMTQGLPEQKEAPSLVADISKLVFNRLTKR